MRIPSNNLNTVYSKNLISSKSSMQSLKYGLAVATIPLSALWATSATFAHVDSAKDNPILKDLREIPRGISYWKGFKNNKSYEGFKVRKIGIKNKECISPTEKNILQENLKRAIDYLHLHY